VLLPTEKYPVAQTRHSPVNFFSYPEAQIQSDSCSPVILVYENGGQIAQSLLVASKYQLSEHNFKPGSRDKRCKISALSVVYRFTLPTKVRVCRDASGNKSCVFKVRRSLYERFSVVSNESFWNTLFGKTVRLLPERSSVVKLTSELNTVAGNVVTLLEEIFRVFIEIRVSNIFGCNVVM